MKRLAINTLAALPLKWLHTLSNHQFIVPFYHTVSDEELPHIKYLFRHRRVREFCEDLDFFLQHFAPTVLSFAFPFRDLSMPEALYDELHRHGIDLTFGSTGMKRDFIAKHIQRLAMEIFPVVGEQRIRTALASSATARFVGRNHIHRKQSSEANKGSK